MEHQTLGFAWIDGGTPRESVARTVEAGAVVLAANLGAYRFGRRAEIRAEDLAVDPDEVEWEGEGEGMLKLRFRESEFLACRYETAHVPHEALMRFRVEEGRLLLTFLAAPEETRMDGL
jgi:hypothetical protein